MGKGRRGSLCGGLIVRGANVIMGHVTGTPRMAAAAVIITAAVVAGCGSASKQLARTELDHLVARQARQAVSQPRFVAQSASGVQLTLGTDQVSPVDKPAALRAAKSVAAVPLSTYRCWATSPARGSSAAYKCIIGFDAAGIATATCSVSTGRCGSWAISLIYPTVEAVPAAVN